MNNYRLLASRVLMSYIFIISSVGVPGFLALSVAGAGGWSLDAKLK